MFYDLATGEARRLPERHWGAPTEALALDPAGEIAAVGSIDGLIRVGAVAGGEPHLLAGHRGPVEKVAISPDLRWVASAGTDGTLRLWPMPELSKPPLHTLPHDELVARLKSLTNLRAAQDEQDATGWRIEVGPFPGWKEVPTW